MRWCPLAVAALALVSTAAALVPAPSEPPVPAKPLIDDGRWLSPPNPDVYPEPPFRQGSGWLGSVRTRSSHEERVLVLLIEFPNLAHSGANTPSVMASRMFSTTPPSVASYFVEVSYNQMGMTGAVAPSWLAAPNPYENYGADSASGVDDRNGPVYRLVTAAVNAANPSVDFSQFDGDADGVVDHLVVLHAGDGQEASTDADLIWSHRWAVVDADANAANGDQPLMADGVRVYGYILAAETSPVGVVVHEFTHDLGLPDLYDSDGTSEGVGSWDLLAGGAWLGNPRGSEPAHLSAWGKVKLEWAAPIVVGDPLIGQSIRAAESFPDLFKLPVQTATGGEEYFLVENRQRAGYDSALPGTGLLIWHVDESVQNNDVDTHRLLDLEEADEQSGDNPTQATDPWDASDAGWGPDTYPNSNGYGNARTGWKVRKIGPSGATMVADLAKEVLDDLAVANVQKRDLAAANETQTITVSVQNRGRNEATAFTVGLVVTLGVPPNAPIRLADEQAMGPLASRATLNLTWTFTPTTKGLYVVEAYVDLPEDEIPENNYRLVRFLANAPEFHDAMEAGQGQWVTYDDPGDTYRWQLVTTGDPGYDAWSPETAWRFGYANSTLLPPLMSDYRLETVPIAVQPGPLYLAFWHRFILAPTLDANLTPSAPPIGLSDRARVQLVEGSTVLLLDEYSYNQRDWRMAYWDLSTVFSAPATIRLRFDVDARNLSSDGGWWIDDVFLLTTPLPYAVALRTSEYRESAEPGTFVDFRFKVFNLGFFDDEIAFQAGGVPPGWQAALSTNGTDLVAVGTYVEALGPEGEQALLLRVQTPTNAKRGIDTVMTLSAYSTRAVVEPSTLTFTVRTNEIPGRERLFGYAILAVVVLSELAAVVIVIDIYKRRQRKPYVPAAPPPAP